MSKTTKPVEQRRAATHGPGGALAQKPIEVPSLEQFKAAGGDPANYSDVVSALRAESDKTGRPLVEAGATVHHESDEEVTPVARSLVPGAGEKSAKPKTSGPSVLIRNAKDSIQTIAMSHPQGSDHGGHTHHTLMPGVNRVPLNVWEGAKKLATIGHQLDEGDLVELEAKSLAELKQKPAIALVNETVDRSLLAEWQRAEHREPVRHAIETQIQKIAPTTQEPKTEDEEDEDEGETPAAS